MAIEHADITDPLLHEPKGVSTAAANRVYLSDGAGSGSWSRIPTTALTDSVTAFNSQLLHVQYVGIYTFPAQLTWVNAPLNTVVTNDISATLNANTLTLSAGTYLIDGIITGQGGSAGDLICTLETRLYNSTTSTSILAGTADLHAGNQLTSTPGWRSHVGIMKSFLKGRFTLGNNSNISIQNNIKHNFSGGYVEPKLWHNIMIWKVG